VRSRDSAGYLSAPTPDLQVTSTHTGPSVPGALSASNVTSDSASVSWSASTPVSGRIVGYVVYKNGIPVGQTTSLTESLVNLAPETTYDVSVAAVDSLGATSAQAPAIDVQTGVPVQSTGAVQAFLLATTSQSFQDFEARYQQIGTVYPTYFDCTPQAAITGNNDPLVTDWAQERGVAVMPRINCQDPTVVNEILTDPTITQQTIATLASLAQSNGYQGLMIDFESNLPSDRSAFTAFITALAAQLHAQGEKLATVVTAKTYNIQSGRAAIYDDAALSVPSDWVFVLDWGLHWTTSGPGAMDDLPWSTQVADYVASMPNKGKFVLGLPLYGIDWPAGSGASNPGTPLQYADVVALEAQYGITPSWDPVAQAPYFNYTDASGVAHTVYYTDAQSVQARVALAQSLGLNVGFWRLGTEDPGVWGLPGLGS
jgi:spore germination protein YaaH